MGLFDDVPVLTKEQKSKISRQGKADKVINLFEQALGRSTFPGGPLTGANISSQAAEGIGEELVGLQDTLTGGIPREVFKRTTGLEFPQGRPGGRLAGLAVGGTAIRNLLKKAGIKTTTFVGRALLGALEGAGTSQLAAPEKDFFDPKERGIAAGAGAALGPVGELAAGTFPIVKRQLTKVARRPEVIKRTITRAGQQFKKIEEGLKNQFNEIKNKLKSPGNS